MAKKMTAKHCPQVGEVFKLELDADVPENTPDGMIKAFGHNHRDWGFTCIPLTGKLERNFKLVQIGPQPDLKAAKERLEAEYGPTPSGQWMKAFNDAYPKPDDKGPIGVADFSWAYPGGFSRFPYVGYDGKPGFYHPGIGLGEGWRWLVSVPEGE